MPPLWGLTREHAPPLMSAEHRRAAREQQQAVRRVIGAFWDLSFLLEGGARGLLGCGRCA